MIDNTTKKAFQSLVLAGWGLKTGGSIDFPFGHFSVVRIPDHAEERAQMREVAFSDSPEEAEAFDKVEAGWFFVVQTNEGAIYVNHCKDEAAAGRRFERRERAYFKWMTPDE